MFQGKAPGKLPEVSFSLSDVLCMWIWSSKEIFRNHVSSEGSDKGARSFTVTLEEKDGTGLRSSKSGACFLAQRDKEKKPS